MNLRNTVKGQMAYSLCFFRNPPLWIAIPIPILICYSFWGYGLFSIFLTTMVLILSTLVFTFSRPKPLLVVNNSVKAEAVTCVHQCLLDHQSVETVTQKKENEVGQIVDSFSESESIAQSFTSDDSEVEWAYSGNVGQIQDCSDGSISDEESLIEISLPSGHYHYVDDPKEEEEEKEEKPKSKSQEEFPIFWPESLSRENSLMELFSEINDMNEEENLIEIDISMGSIKCSRFEIEA